MTSIEAIAAIGVEPAPASALLGGPVVHQDETTRFGELIARSVRDVEGKVETAQDLVRAFALDEPVPIHQVTIALEEARLAVELAMQVRNRLVDGYRELMNMQL